MTSTSTSTTTRISIGDRWNGNKRSAADYPRQIMTYVTIKKIHGEKLTRHFPCYPKIVPQPLKIRNAQTRTISVSGIIRVRTNCLLRKFSVSDIVRVFSVVGYFLV